MGYYRLMRDKYLRWAIALPLLGCSIVWAEATQVPVTPEEAAWLEANPDAIVDLSEIPPDQLQKFVDLYQGLTPEEQGQLRDNADALRALSADEQALALDNPAAVRQLGKLPEAERNRLLKLYRDTDPATQRRLLNAAPTAR